MQLRVLTIYQPWASAIMLGMKRYETRGWNLQHRGPLVIHAGLADHRDFQVVFEQTAIRGEFMDAGYRFWTDLPRGAILGLVNVTDCLAVETVREAASKLELSLGDFRDGRFAFECSSPIHFQDPVPARGHQKIWTWDVPELTEPVVKGWMKRTEVLT